MAVLSGGDKMRALLGRGRRWISTGSTLDPLIGLSSERQALYKTAFEFGKTHFSPHAAQWDETSTFPRELMKECAKMGYGGMMVPISQGGAGWKRVDAVCAIEALARHCVSTTAMLTIHNACTGIVAKMAHPSRRDNWARLLCSMEWMASFCLTEPGSGSDAASIVTHAAFDEATQEFVLNGQKCFISGAGMSDIYLVMCRTAPAQISCLAVLRGSAGLSFGAHERKMGWRSQPTRQVFFDNVRVPANHVVGATGAGFKIAMQALDGARLSVAACSVGGAHTCWQATLEHCQQEEVQQMQVFRLADMAGKILRSRELLRAAAEQLDAGSSTTVTHCAMTKLLATDLGSEVCSDALQLMGVAGLARGAAVERMARDLRVHQILEGTNEIMRFLLGRALVA